MGGPDAGRNLGAKEKHPSVMIIVKLSGDGRRLGCANLDALPAPNPGEMVPIQAVVLDESHQQHLMPQE